MAYWHGRWRGYLDNHFHNNFSIMSELKVSHDKEATSNLQKRRDERGDTGDNFLCNTVVSDYAAHLRRCYVGRTLLDVGCGNQHLKTCLPDGVVYVGMDAFPVVDGTIPMAIENELFTTYDTPIYETVCAFAILDNCRDFHLACLGLKSLAEKNVIILTGIGIEPDKFHTMRLELSDFDREFEGWNNTVRKQLEEKVWLLEYTRQ
jgi:hypothetical protein